jgi:DNA-binding IclR family transcriptional regulator
MQAAANGTQTVQRAAFLLRLLTSHNRLGLRLVDVAAMTQMERPTVHRILQGLIAEGLVAQDRATKKYHLGPLLYEMGLAASPRYQLRDICQPHLQAVAESTGDTVFLMVRSGFDSVCVDRKDGGFRVRVSARDVGQRRPLGLGCAGLVLLAALPDETVERIIAVNDQRQAYSTETITVRELRRRIRLTREMGYVAKTVDGAPGASAIGLVIPDTLQEPPGAITVTALSPRLSGPRKDEVLSMMRRAVADIVLSMRKNLH